MAKTACKCKPAEECEECPEWIFTFADLVMLMMGFFVILWVLKPAPGKGDTLEANEEWWKVVRDIREGFGNRPDPLSTDPLDPSVILRQIQELRRLKGEGEGGRTKLEPRGAEGENPEVLTVRKGSQAIVGTRVLFAAGDAGLNPEAKKILDQIATELKGHRNVSLVNGHASLDDFAEGASAEQKLELSLKRARAAADYLISKGVAPDTLRIVGSSVFEPVAQRAYTPEAKQLNRRVEIEEVRTLVEELKDPPQPALPADSSGEVPASQPAQPARP